MKFNDEKIIVALDGMVTQIDNAIDELLDCDSPESKKAESILLNVSMQLNALVDILTDTGE